MIAIADHTNSRDRSLYVKHNTKDGYSDSVCVECWDATGKLLHARYNVIANGYCLTKLVKKAQTKKLIGFG